MKNISQRAYLGIEIPTPPVPSRARIADVLDETSRAAALLIDLIDAKRRFKRGLLRILLTRKRKSAFTHGAEWTLRTLGEFLTESREHASTGAHARKITVKLYGRGVVAKTDLRAGSANTQYYRRRAGQFIYSKLDFLNGAFGIVPQELDGYESTLDLPAFDVSLEMNIRWLLHLLSWPGFYKRQVRLANGGRKARRVNPSELLKLAMPIPPLQEQIAVAACLDALDREIVLLESLRTTVERQKRSLIDRLLSGELPVAVR